MDKRCSSACLYASQNFGTFSEAAASHTTNMWLEFWYLKLPITNFCMSFHVYWFSEIKLLWVSTGQNFVLVACESFNHLTWSYAKIRNIAEWGALSGFQTSGPRKTEPYLWANRKGGNVFFLFTPCRQQAVLLNLRLWPNLVDGSPPKALLLALGHGQATTVCAAGGISFQREVHAILL